ncbi:MAG: TM0106 family RecB-like putative nuclease [Pseudomonadota bacterium]
MKKYITATDLYNFKKCPYRPYMDYNGDSSLKVEIHPLVKLLWESGVQYEAKVIESFKRDHPDQPFQAISPESPASEKLAQETIKAMEEGIDIIYQGVLMSGNKLGRPDLLLKTNGDSSFGSHHYYPMDIKLTRVDATWDDGNEKTTIEQFWQVYFYGDLLASAQNKRPEKGYIYKTKSRILSVPLYKPPANYEWALNQLENYLNGHAFGAEPIINSNCAMCEWKKTCIDWAEENRDISLVHYVGQAMKAGLKELGISTIEDLAKQNPDELSEKVQKLKEEGFFWKSMPADLPRKVTQRARIYIAGKPVIHEPIIYPESDTEIHFDIEDDPTQDFVYLHGLLLVEKGKEPEYHPFFAEKYEDEKLITEQLIDFLNQYPNAAIYHYSDYEKTTIKRLINKHKLETDIFERLFGENGTAFDLYKVITNNTDWPLTSYGIKAVCKFLGFKWDAADAGGAASIVWMNDYLAGNLAMKEKILRYNEDDCRATHFLKSELIKMDQTS